MDFNRLPPSFEAQTKGLRNLLDLCRDVQTCRPIAWSTFVYVSSIAVVGKYPEVHRQRIVPGIAMSENDCTGAVGFMQSLYVLVN